MLKKKNKARKSKLDLVASLIEDRNIKWTYRNAEGYFFVFEMDDVEIHVSHEQIKMEKRGESIQFFDERFIKELDALKN